MRPINTKKTILIGLGILLIGTTGLFVYHNNKPARPETTSSPTVFMQSWQGMGISQFDGKETYIDYELTTGYKNADFLAKNDLETKTNTVYIKGSDGTRASIAIVDAAIPFDFCTNDKYKTYITDSSGAKHSVRIVPALSKHSKNADSTNSVYEELCEPEGDPKITGIVFNPDLYDFQIDPSLLSTLDAALLQEDYNSIVEGNGRVLRNKGTSTSLPIVIGRFYIKLTAYAEGPDKPMDVLKELIRNFAFLPYVPS